ncbi:MAG: hypothetical protein O7C74_01030 [Acidobacteria bacterium]|nr:hypothetical protein [Acidobacteriota bacterium]
MSRWRLDPGDVTSGWETLGAESPQRKTPARRVWLQHEPTGMQVTAEVVVVPGVPDEPPVLEAELRKSLFAELELKVARHLAITINRS